MRLFRLILLLSACLHAPTVAAQDTQVAYRWRNVAIGGGGLFPGRGFHPGEKSLLVTRRDLGGGDCWGAEETR